MVGPTDTVGTDVGEAVGICVGDAVGSFDTLGVGVGQSQPEQSQPYESSVLQV
jgi:hypothetical protein